MMYMYYAWLFCSYNTKNLQLILLLFLQDFFQNLDKWQEKHHILNESGNFLIETVQEPIADEIKQQLLLLNRRWMDVSDQAREFLQSESVERSRREYQSGVENLTEWLDQTEAMLATDLDCDLQEVKQHAKNLDVSFKNV